MGEIVDHPAAQPERLRAPEHITRAHDLASFDCGEPDLNAWLREKALKNEEGGSRTYVVCAGQKVVGFYCLASGAILRREAIGKVSRNMPEPVPVMVIGRMAVDHAWKKRGIGRGMLKDAILRTLQAAEIVGIRAILVHAKSATAKTFYQEKGGFSPSPVDSMTLMITVADAQRQLARL